MADSNVTLNTGSGGHTIAVDNDGVNDHQYVKLEFGPSGTQTHVSTANPLPIASYDPAATTGTISVVDSGTSTSSANSITQAAVTGSPTANSSVTATLYGHNAVQIQLSGTCNLTLTFEASKDGGTTYENVQVEKDGVGTGITTLSISDNLVYFLTGIGTGGFTQYRVRCTARTSGSCSVTILPTYGLRNAQVKQGVPAGAAGAWPVRVTDLTNFMPTMDAVGRPGFQKITDGTNTMPTGDTAARQLFTSVTAQTTGGYTPGFALGASSDNATNVKGSAGTLGFVYVSNINAAVRYFKVYDKATSPSSSDTPVQVYVIPGSTTGAGYSVPFPPQGLAFSNGIGYRLVTGQANNDNTSVTSTDHVINYGYK